MHNPHHRSKCLRQARNSAFTAPLVKMALPRLPPIAMLRRYSKKHLQHLLEQVNDLKSAVRSLEQQQDILLLQQHCLSCCCDVLHVLRLGSNGPVHPAWGPYSSTWLPGELPLLADLGWSTDKQSADNKDTLNVASTCLLAQRQQQQLQHQEQAVQRRLQLAASRSQTPQQQQSPMMMCCDEEEQEQALSSDGTESLSASWSDQLPFVRPMGAVSTSAADDGGGGSVPDCDPPAPAPAPAPAQATRVFLTPEGPLGVLKWTLEQPPYPGADRFTLSELVQCYSSTVKDMAFHLTLLAQQQELGDSSLGINASSSGCSQHLLALRSLVTQHTRRIATVLLLHPEDLLNSFRMVNLETGELSENPEEAWQRTCWLADKLELTKKQQLSLVAAADLFKRLLDTLRAERLELCAQQAELLEERLQSGRATNLVTQENTARRLQLLVRKERFLLTCLSAIVCSILDVVQLSRCCVMAWPWTANLGIISAIVAKNYHDANGKQ